MQFVHSKAEVNGDLEDNDHRNGDSIRIGPAAKPSAIPKSKLKQVQSEVMSVMPRWPSVLTGFENRFCWCRTSFGFGEECARVDEPAAIQLLDRCSEAIQ